jgi:hypothetical protein
MIVTAIETIRTAEFPNLLWVQVGCQSGDSPIAPMLPLSGADRCNTG